MIITNKTTRPRIFFILSPILPLGFNLDIAIVAWRVLTVINRTPIFQDSLIDDFVVVRVQVLGSDTVLL